MSQSQWSTLRRRKEEFQRVWLWCCDVMKDFVREEKHEWRRGEKKKKRSIELRLKILLNKFIGERQPLQFDIWKRRRDHIRGRWNGSKDGSRYRSVDVDDRQQILLQPQDTKVRVGQQSRREVANDLLVHLFSKRLSTTAASKCNNITSPFFSWFLAMAFALLKWFLQRMAEEWLKRCTALWTKFSKSSPFNSRSWRRGRVVWFRVSSDTSSRYYLQ